MSYVLNILFFLEIWYGIEWKDASRGKHDGSYMGKKYFETKHPTGGSFVKASKVEFGVDIWQAVEEKYFIGSDFEQTQDITKSKDEQNQLLYTNFE